MTFAVTGADIRRVAGTGLTKSEISDRARIAFHEAGHAVAAVLLGSRVRQAVLGDTPRTEYDGAYPAGTEARITYAGPWAEARWLAGRARRPGPADMHRALAANCSDNKALIASGGSDTGQAVVPLLERCWPAVSTVALKLFLDGEVSHANVCAALGLSDDGGPGSIELANIRAALRAVP